MPNVATESTEELVMPSLDGMTKEELEDIASSTPEDIAARLTNPKEDEVDAQIADKSGALDIAPSTKPNAKPTSSSPDEAIEVDLGNGRMITFKNRDELIHNFSSLRMGLDEINAKHGRTVQELQRLKGIDTQFADLQRQLDEMKRSPAQPPKGQQAAATSAMVQTAVGAGIDPDKFFADLTVENFAQKLNQLNQISEEGASKRVRAELEPTIEEIRRENKELKDRFGKIESDMTYREKKSVFDSHYLNLMNEITQLQGKVGSLKTQWTPAQINDAITQYGPEQAHLLVPPGDFEKWEVIESMLKETYCPVDGQGNLDITQRKLKSINGAWAAYVADHPELNDNTIATAHTNGQQQVIDQIRRVADRPPTLPNNFSTEDTEPGAMTIEEASKWINTPADTLKIWERTKDPRWVKFQQAQDFAAKYTG